MALGRFCGACQDDFGGIRAKGHGSLCNLAQYKRSYRSGVRSVPENRDQISVKGTGCNIRAGSSLRVLLGPFACAGSEINV
jgi:hypothetical protein